MRPSVKYIFCLLILALALTVGCGAGKQPLEQEAETPEPADAGEAICLYMFWTRDPAAMEILTAQLDRGDSFSAAARRISREGLEGASRLNATCLDEKELDPVLLEQGQDLGMGQVGRPFDYQGGMAMVMRTSDRWWNQGERLYKQGEYQAAEDSFIKHLELHPDSARAWDSVAQCRLARGENEGALRAYEHALVWQPENASILSEKGHLLIKMGKYSQGVAAFRQAHALAPKNPILTHNLAWALLKEGMELDQAERLARQAIKSRPDEPRFWDTLGQIQKARGENTAAVVSLHRAHYLGSQVKETQQDLVKSFTAMEPEIVARLVEKPSDSKPASAPKPRQAKARPKPKPAAPKTAATIVVQENPEPAPKPAPAPRATGTVTAKSKKGKKGRASKPGYYLVIGSYRYADLARKESSKWRKRGKAVWMEPYRVKGRIWIRVILGPFKSKGEAKWAGGYYIKKRYINEYIVIKRER